MNFSWGKAIGFGVLIWAIMFAVGAILVSAGVVLGTGAWLSLAILAGIVAYLFALGTEAPNGGQAIGYGAVWAAIGIILDAVISQRFQTGIFGLWQYYLGYALVLLAPWLEYETQGSGAHPRAI